MIAIGLSVIGLLLSVLGSFFLTQTGYSLGFFVGVISWGFLLWASIIGFKLSSKYKLDADEFKKVGIRIYLIIVAFILFLFVGFVVGLVLSVALLAGLWALKGNYDDWEYNNIPYVPEETNLSEKPKQ